MKEFDIKMLCTVKGYSILFRFIKSLKGAVLMETLISGSRIAVPAIRKIIMMKDRYIVLEDDKGQLPLEKVFENLSTMEEEGTYIPPTARELSQPEEIEDFMEEMAPYYDRTRFKHHHVDKILGLYKEINTALDMVDEETESQ